METIETVWTIATDTGKPLRWNHTHTHNGVDLYQRHGYGGACTLAELERFSPLFHTEHDAGAHSRRLAGVSR